MDFWTCKNMSANSRKEAEEIALTYWGVSLMPWVVVDCGPISKPEYRVWCETTLNDQLIECPDCVPHFELISRVENGEVRVIA